MLIHIPKERKIQLPHTYQNQKTVKIQDQDISVYTSGKPLLITHKSI